MLFSTIRTFLLLIAILLFVQSCKKDKKESENPAELQVKADAEYNNSIVAGVGNVFVEEKFLANQKSQIFAKVAYNSDTIYFVGSTNSAAKADSLKSIIVAKRNNEFFVTEYFDDQSTSISYNVRNNKQGRLVLRTVAFNQGEREVSLLDYNWTNKTFKVLLTSYYKDGIQVATKLAKSRSDVKAVRHECDKIPPGDADEMNKYLDEKLQFIACNGTHPINEPILALDEKIRALPQYEDIKEEYTLLKDDSEGFTRLWEAVINYFSEFNFTIRDVKELPAWFANLLQSFLKSDVSTMKIELLSSESDLVFNEGVDEFIRVTLKVTNKSDPTLPISNPVLIDLGLKNTGSSESLYSKNLYTTPIDGKVTFLIKPEEIQNLESQTNLEGFFDFKANNLQSLVSFNISFKWRRPHLSIYSGINQTAEYGKRLTSPLVVKVVDEDGKPFNKWPVSWKIKRGNGLIIFDAETNSSGYAEALWTFGNDLREQEVEVSSTYYFDTHIAGSPVTFKASVLDSISIYGAAAVGKWTLTSSIFQNNAYAEIQKFIFNADGSGIYYFVRTAGGESINIEPGNPVYKITWAISGSPNAYYLTINYPDRGWVIKDRIFYTPTIHYGVAKGDIYFLGVKD